MQSARYAMLCFLLLSAFLLLSPLAELTYNGATVSSVFGVQLLVGSRIATASVTPGLEAVALSPQLLLDLAAGLFVASFAGAARRPTRDQVLLGVFASAGAALCLLCFAARLPEDALPSSPGLFMLSPSLALWAACLALTSQAVVAAMRLRASLAEASGATLARMR